MIFFTWCFGSKFFYAFITNPLLTKQFLKQLLVVLIFMVLVFNIKFLFMYLVGYSYSIYNSCWNFSEISYRNTKETHFENVYRGPHDQINGWQKASDCICQDLAEHLSRQLYEAPVSKPLLASAIASGFDVCRWNKSQGLWMGFPSGSAPFFLSLHLL